MADSLHREFLKHLHLVVAERASGSHHDRFTRVDTQGVEVLHAGHGEAVVVGIADYFELNLFPTLQRLFYQYLRSKSESTLCQLHESLFVGTDTATQSTQSISRANHDGETNLVCSCQRVFHRLYRLADGSLHRNFIELLHKEVAVFGVHNSLDRGTQHLHAILLQHTFLIQFGTTVQCSLSAKCQQDAVGALLLDNLLNKIRSYGQEIHFICNTLRSLNRSDVRIYQHRADTFFTQRLQRLRTGVVELSGLANLQGTGAQDEHFLQFLLFHSEYISFKFSSSHYCFATKV